LVNITRADAAVDVVLGQAFKSVATPAAVKAAETKAAKPC
jgi:hypothetical protein